MPCRNDAVRAAISSEPAKAGIVETVTLPSREASSPAWTTSRGEISGKNRGMPAAAIGSVTDEG
jgi:hypothetical protein